MNYLNSLLSIDAIGVCLVVIAVRRGVDRLLASAEEDRQLFLEEEV